MFKLSQFGSNWLPVSNSKCLKMATEQNDEEDIIKIII